LRIEKKEECMKFISMRAHEAIDCIASLVFIVSPFMFGFNDGRAAEWVPIIIGIVLFLMALCTRYGLGVVKIIPFKMHVAMDVVAGLLLALSPWIFGFHHYIWLPHLILGILEMGAALMTRTEQTRSTIPTTM